MSGTTPQPRSEELLSRARRELLRAVQAAIRARVRAEEAVAAVEVLRVELRARGEASAKRQRRLERQLRDTERSLRLSEQIAFAERARRMELEEEFAQYRAGEEQRHQVDAQLAREVGELREEIARLERALSEAEHVVRVREAASPPPRAPKRVLPRPDQVVPAPAQGAPVQGTPVQGTPGQDTAGKDEPVLEPARLMAALERLRQMIPPVPGENGSAPPGVSEPPARVDPPAPREPAAPTVALHAPTVAFPGVPADSGSPRPTARSEPPELPASDQPPLPDSLQPRGGDRFVRKARPAGLSEQATFPATPATPAPAVPTPAVPTPATPAPAIPAPAIPAPATPTPAIATPAAPPPALPNPADEDAPWPPPAGKPWLADALKVLVDENPVVAGRVALALLAAQHLVCPHHLAYDVVLGIDGLVEVDVEPGMTRIERQLPEILGGEIQPRDLSQVSFQIVGTLPTVARLVVASPLRRRLPHGLAKVRGHRGDFAAVRKLFEAPLSLLALHRAGVQMSPPLALALAGAMIDPAWNDVRELVVVEHTAIDGVGDGGGGGEAERGDGGSAFGAFLTVRPGARAVAQAKAPSAPVTMTISCRTEDLLGVLADAPEAPYELHGDPQVLRQLRVWLRRTQRL